MVEVKEKRDPPELGSNTDEKSEPLGIGPVEICAEPLKTTA
jgi:hypothetical protein